MKIRAKLFMSLKKIRGKGNTKMKKKIPPSVPQNFDGRALFRHLRFEVRGCVQIGLEGRGRRRGVGTKCGWAGVGTKRGHSRKLRVNLLIF